MMKEKIPTLKESMVEELYEARMNLLIAQDKFNYADEEYFEVANEELTIAQKKVNLCLWKIKNLRGEDYILDTGVSSNW